MKYLTRGEATKRLQTVEFLRRIGSDDAADDYDDMTSEEYAERRGTELLDNPRTGRAQPETKSDLQDALDQIGDMAADALDPALTREDVIQKLKEIDDIVNGDGDEDEDDDAVADDDPD